MPGGGGLSQRGPATQALTATQPGGFGTQGFGTQSFGGMSQVGLCSSARTYYHPRCAC